VKGMLGTIYKTNMCKKNEQFFLAMLFSFSSIAHFASPLPLLSSPLP